MLRLLFGDSCSDMRRTTNTPIIDTINTSMRLLSTLIFKSSFLKVIEAIPRSPGIALEANRSTQHPNKIVAVAKGLCGPQPKSAECQTKRVMELIGYVLVKRRPHDNRVRLGEGSTHYDGAPRLVTNGMIAVPRLKSQVHCCAFLLARHTSGSSGS